LNEIAIGSGRVELSEASRTVNEWERTANGNQRQKLSKDQAGIMLASMGIKLEIKKNG